MNVTDDKGALVLTPDLLTDGARCEGLGTHDRLRPVKLSAPALVPVQ